MYGGVAYGYSEGMVASQRNSVNAQWLETSHRRCGHGNYRTQNQK